MKTHKSKILQNTRYISHFFLISFILTGSFLFINKTNAVETNVDTTTSTPNITSEESTDDTSNNSNEGENQTTTGASTTTPATISISNTSTNTSSTTENTNTASTTSTPQLEDEDTNIENTTSTTSTVFINPTTITSTTTTIDTELSTTTIHLQIESYDNTLYDDDIIVTECEINENTTSTLLTTYCALQQLNEQDILDIEFTNYGGDARFISKINNYDGSDWNYWAFFHNLEYSSESINEYELNSGDQILLSYGIWPLKLETSSSTPQLNTTTTLSVKEFGFDSSWNAVWTTSTSSTISISTSTGNQEFFSANGSHELKITTTTPYQIFASKENFVTSSIINIDPVVSTATTSTTSTEEEENNNNSSNGNNNNNGSEDGDKTNETNEDNLISTDTLQQSAKKILNYLKSQQDETGKIIDGNMTDWAIMSFGADNQYADDIKQANSKSLLEYEKEYNLDEPADLNSCATYPRHVLALLSAGVETSDPAIVGLKENMYSVCYDDTGAKYGQNGINDDVFALLALLALDTNVEENIITDIIAEIKTWQLDSGAFSWPDWLDPSKKTAGDDITGASINALNYAKQKGANINQDILDNATNYLKTTQKSDGGWGYSNSDIMTTSWVLMGINSLEQNQSDWQTTSSTNPWHPLVKQLNDEGFYESSWTPGAAMDSFAMKHAVPAILGASWPIILEPTVDDFSEGASFTYSSGGYTPIVENEEEDDDDDDDNNNSDEDEIKNEEDEEEIIEENKKDNEVKESEENSVTQTFRFDTAEGDNVENNKKDNVTQTFRSDDNEEYIIDNNKEKNVAQTFRFDTIEGDSVENNRNEQTLSPDTNTSTLPYHKTAKGVFAGASSMASALGLYLAWRFAQTLL